MKLISTNPSKNYEVIGEVEVSTKKNVEDAAAKARTAFQTWSALSLQERCRILNSFLTVSEKHTEEIAQVMCEEMGRTIVSCRANVREGIDYFKAYIDMAETYLSPKITLTNDTEIHRVYREPWGVIAAICPWNYPYQNIAWQCGQALIAGNTIIYKNSEENPLFSKLLEKLISESKIPDGVFNILYGDGKVAQMMIEEDINMISFTGSSKVGQLLARQAAEKFIPIVLELGGSSPAIVFEDVKIDDQLISYISDMRFSNCGQLCDAVKRLLVHKSKFDEVVEKLSKHVSQLKVGEADKEDTDMGPLVAKRQLELIEVQVADAVVKGAKVVLGGKRPDHLKGAYYLPTILTNISKDMRVFTEETFGPVLPVIPFEDEPQAIRMANHTDYGLSAHIFTSDKKRFERVAAQIKAGSIAQNQVAYWNPKNPFGGYKKSGMGRIHGEFGFDDFTQIKLVSEEK